MTTTLAITVCFCTLAFLTFAFFLTIYIMEFRREAAAIKEYIALRKQQETELKNFLNNKELYVVDLPLSKSEPVPKKKVQPAIPPPIKDKKNIN